MSVCWIDGRLAAPDEPVARADDSAYREGRGCYATALARSGRVLHRERHVARLVRDAARLGLGPLDPALVGRAFDELARAAFARSEGAVRVQASADGDGGTHLVGTVRELGADPAQWTAVAAPFAHPGPWPYASVKATNHLLFAAAREHAGAAGADEALLFDAAGRLVEGTRSNLVVVRADGAARTPPLARGCVEGVGREIALERVPGLEEGDVERGELADARELVALNGLRGARPIVRLDGIPVGDGAPGPWAKRLAGAFEPGPRQHFEPDRRC